MKADNQKTTAKFPMGGKRPKRDVDLALGLKPIAKVEKKKRAKEGTESPQGAGRTKTILIRVRPELHDLLLDMIYTKRVGGDILASQATIIAEALEEYARKRKPKPMPAKIREQYSNPTARK